MEYYNLILLLLKICEVWRSMMSRNLFFISIFLKFGEVIYYITTWSGNLLEYMLSWIITRTAKIQIASDEATECGCNVFLKSNMFIIFNKENGFKNFCQNFNFMLVEITWLFVQFLNLLGGAFESWKKFWKRKDKASWGKTCPVSGFGSCYFHRHYHLLFLKKLFSFTLS